VIVISTTFAVVQKGHLPIVVYRCEGFSEAAICLAWNSFTTAQPTNACAMRLRRRGYTIFELLLVVTIIGAVAALAIPKMKEPMIREQVRSARRAMVTHFAMARGAAASRGCRSVVHVVAGANARVWVTACSVAGANVDTVGAVDQLSDRYGVSVQSSVNSVQFAPNGIAIGAGWSTMVFDRAGFTDTLTVSPLGKASW